ncbi:MAG: hypothetical protein PHY60_03020 [Atopobiaceae bacterium]|nr:hypothetical protein [Atopobiaceae bacterium]
MNGPLPCYQSGYESIVKVVDRSVPHELGIVLRLLMLFEKTVDLVVRHVAIAIARPDEGTLSKPALLHITGFVAWREFRNTRHDYGSTAELSQGDHGPQRGLHPLGAEVGQRVLNPVGLKMGGRRETVPLGDAEEDVSASPIRKSRKGLPHALGEVVDRLLDLDLLKVCTEEAQPPYGAVEI